MNLRRIVLAIAVKILWHLSAKDCNENRGPKGTPKQKQRYNLMPIIAVITYPILHNINYGSRICSWKL